VIREEVRFGEAEYVDQILHGDNVQVLSSLPSEVIDLSVFSPPYDGIRDYNSDWALDVIGLGRELYRTTKDGGIAAMVIGDATKDFAKSLTSFRWALDWCDHCGWRMFETCIYQRAGNPGAWWNRRFRVDHEYIMIFLKGGRPRHFDKSKLMIPSKHAGKIYSGTDRLTNGGTRQIEPKEVNAMKCRGTVWPYSTSNTEGNRTKLRHPATFPDKLAEDLIGCFSEPGDLIADPFSGSGTTCVMARNAGRRYLGIDVSAEYVSIANERLVNETQLRMVQ
jgi:site-specific DNA-methyltransferase (adenine-specific)